MAFVSCWGGRPPPQPPPTPPPTHRDQSVVCRCRVLCVCEYCKCRRRVVISREKDAKNKVYCRFRHKTVRVGSKSVQQQQPRQHMTAESVQSLLDRLPLPPYVPPTTTTGAIASAVRRSLSTCIIWYYYLHHVVYRWSLQ